MNRHTFVVCASVVFILSTCGAPLQAQTTAVSGRVIDARTGQPLARVLIHAEHQPSTVETDALGRFTLALPPGPHTISASLIGYGLVRSDVHATTAAEELVITLSEGAGSHEERVTVAGAAPQDADRAPAGAVLHGRDLQALRGVMLDDPLRAVQALPSATATDDFYSEFAVRGSGVRHLGLAIDGVPAPYLIHSIHHVTDGGSIAMVNSEALASASLLPGSYPQQIGRRLGAHVALMTREGSRDRVHGRVGLSGTSAAFVGEGPLGGRGSWVVSARRSYLDFLLRRIDPDGAFGFGFSDALGKVTFDISGRSQLQVLTVLGRSVFDEEPDDIGVNDERTATSRAWLSAAAWRFTPTAKLAMTQRLYATGTDYRNVNPADVALDQGEALDVGWRADLAYAPRDGWLAEFGGDVQRSGASHTRRRTLDGATSPTLVGEFDATERASSAYGQLSMRVRRLVFAPGGRIDYWGPTGVTASPWITGELTLTPQTRMRGGAGIYRQFPALTHLYGIGAATNLVPEYARHVDVGLSHALPRSTTAQVTAFVREERDVLRAVGAEPRRMPDGSIELGRGDARWSNRLAGHARGVEAVVRRDAPNGLTGWIAYAYTRQRYDDVVSNEQFWGDTDQRHTFSAYGLYHVSNRTTIGAKFRYGSNYPITGYIREQPPSPNAPPLLGGSRPVFFGLAEVRNTLRLPAYARLDVRADRTVPWAGRRLTLFAEVANVLNRRNERNVPYSVDRAGRVSGVTDSLLPIVPSAGFVIEF